MLMRKKYSQDRRRTKNSLANSKQTILDANSYSWLMNYNNGRISV